MSDENRPSPPADDVGPQDPDESLEALLAGPAPPSERDLQERLMSLEASVNYIAVWVRESLSHTENLSTDRQAISSGIDALGKGLGQRVASLEGQLSALLDEARGAITEDRSAARAATREFIDQVASSVRDRLTATEARVELLAGEVAKLTGEAQLIRQTTQLLDEARPESEERMQELFAEVRSSVESRVDALDGRLGELGKVLAAARPDPAAFRAGFQAIAEGLSGRFEALEVSSAGLADMTLRVSEAVERLSMGVAGISGPLTQELERATSEVLRVRASVAEDVDGLKARLDASAEALERLAVSTDAARATTAAFAEDRGNVDATLRELREAFAEERGTVDATLSRFVEQFRERMTAIQQALVASLEGQATRLLGAESESISELRTSVKELRDGLSEQVDQAIQPRLDALRQDVAGTVRESVAEVSGDLQTRIGEGLRGVATTFQSLAEGLRSEMASSMEAIRSGGTSGVEELRTEVAGAIRSIEKIVTAAGEQARRHADSLTKVESKLAALGEGVSQVASRRGFQQLVDNEQKLLQQHGAVVQQLEGARAALVSQGEALSERLASIEGELEGTVRGLRAESVADVERLRSAVRSSLSDVSKEMAGSIQGLREHIEKLAGPRSDIEAVGTELEASVLALRSEFKSLSSDLASTQASLEEGFRTMDDDLKGRLGAVENRLVESVAKEVDRKFETLTRLIEAGMPQVESLMRLAEPQQPPAKEPPKPE